MVVRLTLDLLYTDMKEATVGRWLKQEGESVALGEPVVELITDKITFELESAGAGPLRRVYFPEKSVVPVGCTLAVLAEAGEALPDIDAENRERTAAWEAEVAPQTGDGGRATGAAGEHPSPVSGLRSPVSGARGEGVRATPSARRLAREHSLDLAEIPHPADAPITERDVQAHLEKR